MVIRKAAPADAAAIAALYDQARTALRAAGVDQWQGKYPNRDSALADIQRGWGYVMEDGGRVVATACLGFGHDPTYDVIEGGAWRGEGEYGFLHRVAVDPAWKGRGAAGAFFAELKRQAAERGVGSIRGDTHRDNRPMQRVMEKSGLEPRGIIYEEEGHERLAYEWLRPDAAV